MDREENSVDGGVSHGTINIVLANNQGIVALTDSMVTVRDHQLPDAAQKLFKLDERSVCTIADFLSAPHRPSQLYLAASALISDYAVKVASKPPQTIREHLRSLAFLLQLLLSAATAVRDAGESLRSEVIVAGYDADGVARIGQVKLRTVSDGFSMRTQLYESSILEVGKQLVSKLGGMRDIAEQFLSHPVHTKDNSMLTNFATSLLQDSGESLTTSEMRTLASHLAKRTAEKYKWVGGEDQVAVLQQGRIVSFEQPAFPRLPESLIAFSLVADTHIQGPGPPMGPIMSEGPVVFAPGQSLLFRRTKFGHVRRQLDGNYFFGCSFNNCILRYDGGPFHFDEDNQVVRTALILGPNVNIDDPRAKELLQNFPWFGSSILGKPRHEPTG